MIPLSAVHKFTLSMNDKVQFILPMRGAMGED